MSKDPAGVWLALDGNGGLHGPFASLAGKGGFVFYAAEQTAPLPEPIVLMLVPNGDARSAAELAGAILTEALERLP